MNGRKNRNKRRGPRARRTKSNLAEDKSTLSRETKLTTNEGDEDEKIEIKEKSKSTGEEPRKKETIDLSHGPCIPVGVSSRLTYPMVRQSLLNDSTSSPSEGDDEDEDEEEESVELNIRPRFIFVSSLCAVCLKKSALVCEDCGMVSYCSATHRTKGSANHRKLCDALAEIRCSLLSMQSSSNDSQSTLDADQYRVYRLQLLAVLETKVGRPLELWEREIVLYPKVCRTCRVFSDELICCGHCGMEYFCENHDKQHATWCEQFQIFRRYLYLQHRHGSIHPKLPNVRHGFAALAPTNLDEFMCEMYGNSAYYREMDCYTYSVLSHVSTIPLTTLYAMRNISADSEWQKKSECTVHVIGAEFQFEGINLHVWESLFLHLLPNLRSLRVMLIGPELRLPAGVPSELLSRVKLCPSCKRNGRSVTVSFQPEKLYHELTRGAAGLIDTPDLICAFNPGLYRRTGFAGRDTWLETIRQFSRVAAPVVITAYTADEILWEMARVKSVADFEILLQPRRNPFASIKPDRNFVSDDVNPLIYKNYYVSVIKGKRALSW